MYFINQQLPSHTHMHTHTESDWKVYESPIKLMRSYWTDGITHSLGTGGVVGGGGRGRQLEGGWGIRECFIQRVLTSLSVALIYTTPPPNLSSALRCVNYIPSAYLRDLQPSLASPARSPVCLEADPSVHSTVSNNGTPKQISKLAPA